MTQLATDPFTRADSGTLGANWTKLSGFNDLRITSNACKSSSGDSADAYTGVGAISVNMYAQCTINDQNDGGPCVRMNTTSTFYLLDTDSGATTGGALFKCVTGTFTYLTETSLNWTAGDTAYLEVQGTTLISKQNGTTRHNFTDSAINGTSVGGAYPGLFASGTNIVHDNFAMGDFAVAVTMQPWAHGGLDARFAPLLAQ